MQVSTGQFFRRQNENLVDLQTKIAELQNKIATGKQLELPSDDPVAFSDASRYKHQLAKLEQYGRNIDNVKQRLNAEEATLNQFANVLTRVQELAIQGANDTLSLEDRKSIALEIDLLRDEVIGLANSKDNLGGAVFGGYRTGGQIFVKRDNGYVDYVGDTNIAEVEVAEGIFSPSSNNGQATFMQVSVPEREGSHSIFSLLSETISALRKGESGKEQLNGIAAALDHVVNARVISGTRLGALSTQKDILENDKTNSKVMLSGVEDTDIEQIISQLKQKMLSLEASQAAFVKIAELSLFNYLR
jgi:flagellar hook-associated protein 3 FlgL